MLTACSAGTVVMSVATMLRNPPLQSRWWLLVPMACTSAALYGVALVPDAGAAVVLYALLGPATGLSSLISLSRL